MFGIFKKSQKVDTDKEKVEELITRGVEDVFVVDSLRKKLLSGKPLRIKLGFDPTGSNIHIGRAVVLRKLRAFQDMGHTIVFLVGDFTAQIGDPSDKTDKRPMISREKVLENLKQYKKQVGMIVDLSKAEFHFNSTWLDKLGFQEICELAESFSVQQMSSRRNFKERFEKGQDISLREFLYPLMQGYDSVKLRADIEIGGFDQLFKLKAGRTIQKHYGQPEQDVLTIQMLEGTDGRKMSTSWGNVINMVDEPNDMFGKVMSLRDDLIEKYFLLATDTPLSEIAEIHNRLEQGGNPRDEKILLAERIVALYHGTELAAKAKQAFIETFSKGGVPDDIEQIQAESGAVLGTLLVGAGIVSSKSDWKRLVVQGGVTDTITGSKISDEYMVVEKNLTLKIGKRRFVDIAVK